MSVSLSQTNNPYNFYPTWVPSSDDWGEMFAGKVDALDGWLTNPTVLGALTLTNAPTAPSDAASKAYVDGKLSGSTIPDAPSNGTPYCRMNSSWVPAPTTITASVTGDLTVPGHLTVGLTAIIDGSLQIGTTANAAYMLNVNGNGLFTGGITVDVSASLPCPVTVGSDTVAHPLLLDGPAASSRVLGFQTAGLSRWQIVANATPESGANAGSNLDISGFSDTGASLLNPAIRIIRATGNVLINNTTDAGYRLDVAGSVRVGTATANTNVRSVISYNSAAAYTAALWFQNSDGGNTNYFGLASGAGAGSVPELSLGTWDATGTSLTPWALFTNTNVTFYPPVTFTGGVNLSGQNSFTVTPGVTPLMIIDDPAMLAPPMPPTASTTLWLVSATTGARMLIDAIGTSAGATIGLRKTLGTAALPLAVTANTYLGTLQFLGYDGTGWFNAININGTAQNAWTPTDHSSLIQFLTTPSGTTAMVENMRLINGRALIGTTIDDGTNRLQIFGNARFDNYPYGSPTPALPATGTGIVLAAANNTWPRLAMFGFGSASAGTLTGYAAGGTRAAPVALANTNPLLNINGIGYGATGWSAAPRGQISLLAAENWSDAAQGTAIAFSITPPTTIATAEAMRLQASGNLSIGRTADAGYKLDVNGEGRFLQASGAPALIADSGAGGAFVSLPTGTTFAVTGPDATTVRSVIVSYGAANSVLDGFNYGGTRAAAVATAIGRKLLAVRGNGYDGTAAVPNGEINFTTTEPWTATAHGTQTQFWGTQTGTLTIAEWMRLNNGNLLIGTTTDNGYRLDVAGTARVNLPSTAIGASPLLITNGQTTFPVAALDPAALSLVVNSGATGATQEILSFGNGPAFLGAFAEGTAAAPLAVSTNDTLCGLWGNGYDGTAWLSGANIALHAAEPWSAAAHGTMIAFGGTPLGSSAGISEWARLVNGNLLINNTVSATAGYRLDVVGTARFDNYPGGWPSQMQPLTGPGVTIAGPDGTGVRLALFGFKAAGAGTGTLTGYYAGGTRVTPSGLVVNDSLLNINGIGYGATGWSTPRAQIAFLALEPWSDTAQGTGMSFRVANLGTATTLEGMRLQPSGNLSIGIQTDGGYKLNVNGSANVIGNFVIGGNVGAASAPGGTIAVGTTSPLIVSYAMTAMPPAPTNATAWLVSATQATLGMDSFNNANTFRLRAAMGSQSAPTAMTNGAPIANMQFQGYDGTAYSASAAAWTVWCSQPWTPTNHATFQSWYVTLTATTTQVEAMRLSFTGNLLLGAPVSPDNTVDRLQVAGSARISSGLGMFGHVAPTAQPSFTGAKGGNTALASVIAVLVAMGVALDTTTA
jgi:hypothetical protein